MGKVLKNGGNMDPSQRLLQEAQRLLSEGRDSEVKWLLERTAIDALNLLGSFYSQKIRRPDLAVSCLKTASSIDRGNYTVSSNLAHVLNMDGRFQEAAPESLRAVSTSRSEVVGPLMNCAVVMNNCQRNEEAIVHYRRCLELEDNLMTRYNLACCLLLNGDYAEGWRYYDSRLRAFEKTLEFEHRYTMPRWDGSLLDGKSIVVYSEQGIGDLINFCRFLPELYERGASKVILESQEPLAGLMEFNYPNVEVVPRGDDNYPPAPHADMAISICSLTGALGYDSPEKINGEPYLYADGRMHPRSLEKRGNLRVGISWAGNPDHAHDYMRSCPVRHFSNLAVDGVDLYSLQKDTWPIRDWKGKQVNVSQGKETINMTDLSPFMKDFLDTAACLKNLDLVITIDSAVAHLAGAMGVPVWMLIPTIPDWRWLKHRPDTAIWYDSMRIYRQSSLYDWPGVFTRVQGDLVAFAADKANLG